jgi:uncharacterized protein YjbK
MDHHLEVELKWSLSAGEHGLLAHRLQTLLGPPRLLEQDNRFFDSADGRLLRSRLNLRLRRENQGLLMTCKRKAGEADALGTYRHDEWEQWLDPALWPQLAEPTAASMAELARLPLPPPLVDALEGAALRALGGFSNLRQEFPADRPGGSDLLCLDRTTFPGGRVDHELEIETSDPGAAAAHWRGVLASWGITPPVQGETKFARFIAISRRAAG